MELSVPVSRIAFGGDGVGRLPDGKVCFIPGALPGETVRAEITHEAKSFARARVLDVLMASPERVEPDCPLGRPAIRELLASAAPGADGQKRTFRWTLHDGALDSGSDAWRRTAHLTEQLGTFGDFRVPKASFFQVNIATAAALAERVLALLKETGTEQLLELYCGSGVFSILAAEHIPGLTARAVELDKAAIDAANYNAVHHGVAKRCTFLAADAGEAFRTLAASCDPAKCCVLVDPPRTGLPASLTQDIGWWAPEAVLYVSCGPDTLRRDADRLAACGFRIRTAGMIDMFPATGHFESVTLFGRCA